MLQVKAPEMRQTVAIAGVQKLEHFCIAAWGTVHALANEISEEEMADEITTRGRAMVPEQKDHP